MTSTVADSANQLTDAPAILKRAELLPAILISFALIALCFGLFAPILFNWFACDDFTHLCWLRGAIHQPELILRNFHSSWLDFPLLKFYRPFISITFVTDYLLWHENALGYHITNVAFHAGTSIFLFLFLKDLSGAASGAAMANRVQQWLWPTAAAALFAVHPLHPEVVAWITGRVDSVMACFYMASLWCYARWRRTDRQAWMVGAMTSACISLLSKEMAVTLPPTIIACELICFSNGRTIIAASRASLKKTLPFCILLAVYFAVRALSLGTILGGYGDSLSFNQSLSGQLAQWAAALKVMLVPANADLISPHHNVLGAWIFSLCACGMLTATACIQNRWSRRIGIFLSVWAALSLVPVYKILAITPTLQGARLAYLFTVPLCALLCLGLTISPRRTKFLVFAQVLALASIGTLLYSGAALLARNDRAWIASGLEMTAICRTAPKAIAPVSPSAKILLLHIPDEIHGAYAAQGASGGITNFSNRNIKVVGQLDYFGLYKSMMESDPSNAAIFWWDSEKHAFDSLPLNVVTTSLTGSGIDLAAYQKATGVDKFSRESDGQVIATCAHFAGEVELRSPASNWSADFLEVPVQVIQGEPSTIGARIESALLPPIFQWQVIPNTSVKQNTVLFNLHNLPAVALSCKPVRISLLLPAGRTYKLGAALYRSAHSVMPAIVFKPTSSNDMSVLELTQSVLGAITCDAHGIPGAAHVKLEVRKAANYFSEVNTPRASTQIGLFNRELTGTIGTINLQTTDFPGPGVYQARTGALDANHQPVGCTGDQFTILVK